MSHTGKSEKDTSSLSLEDAIEVYKREHLPSRNYAPRTRVEYISDLTQLIGFLSNIGIQNIDQVNRNHLESYLAELDRKGYAGQTRRRKTASIRSLFSFLHLHELISNNIALGLIPPRSERKEPRVLSEIEYKELLRACSYNTRDAAIIELFLQTGIRLSELTNLTIKDVSLPTRISKDPEHIGILKIRSGKGRKDRSLPLNFKVSRALSGYLKIRPDVESNSFFINKFGNTLGPRGVQNVISKYLYEIGIQDATVHSLRHTFGTHHIAKGTSLRTVQEALGHRDLKTTSIYVSLARTVMNKELQDNAL